MKKIHIGCGNNYIETWINIDISKKYKTDLNLDIRNGLPFNNNTVDYIYSEHFIEHLTLKEGVTVLKECKRILKKNGVVRLSTPDLNELLNNYTKKNLTHLNNWNPQSLCDMVNEGMRKWEHKYLYDYEKLKYILHSVGFKNVNKSDYQKSKHKPLINLEYRIFNYDLIIECENETQIISK